MREDYRGEEELVIEKMEDQLDVLLEHYFPEARSGDVSPDAWIAFLDAIENLLDDWIMNNVEVCPDDE